MWFQLSIPCTVAHQAFCPHSPREGYWRVILGGHDNPFKDYAWRTPRTEDHGHNPRDTKSQDSTEETQHTYRRSALMNQPAVSASGRDLELGFYLPAEAGRERSQSWVRLDKSRLISWNFLMQRHLRGLDILGCSLWENHVPVCSSLYRQRPASATGSQESDYSLRGEKICCYVFVLVAGCLVMSFTEKDGLGDN